MSCCTSSGCVLRVLFTCHTWYLLILFSDDVAGGSGIYLEFARLLAFYFHRGK